MSWFLLSPIYLDAVEWSASVLIGKVQMEAEDEESARFLADKYLCHGTAAARPWKRRDLVAAQPIRAPDAALPKIGKRVFARKSGEQQPDSAPAPDDYLFSEEFKRLTQAGRRTDPAPSP